MWPYSHLERAIGSEQLKRWYSEDTIAKWRAEGLTDVESDEVAVLMGTMPMFVWPGWVEAGLDREIYP